MKKNKTKKDKPKYGLLSNVIYAYKNIWKYDKFLVFAGLLIIPINLIVKAIGVYLPSYVLNLFEMFTDFEKIVLGIGMIIFIQFIAEIIKIVVDEKTNSAALIILFRLRAQFVRVEHRRDYFLTLDDEYVKKENYAKRAVENNHSAGVNYPIRFSNVVYQILAFILFGTFISFINPVILIIIIIGVVLNYIMLKWEKDRNSKTWKRRATTNKKMNYLNYYVNRDYRCGKDIRLFSLVGYFRELSKRLMKQTVEEHHETERRSFIVALVSFLMVFLRDGVSYYFLIKMVIDGKLNASEFVLHFSAITAISELLVSIVNSWGGIYEGSIQISHLREYYEIPNVLKEEGGLKADLSKPYEIEFKNVSYKYPQSDEFTLKNINIKINAGEKIAVVGLNGAGKTTLTMLMCGLLLPTEGEVLLNGHNILEYNKWELYSIFSFVSQVNSMVPASIEDNICVKEEKNYERLVECLKLSGLYEKVMSLPEKEKTPINKRVFDNGIELSGGEIQKMILARAIYKKHSILVLDEPTSALDPIAESEMYQKYNQIANHATSVFISHRLASTRFCDRIIFLKDNIIAELGTHDELMALGKEYKALFNVQSKYYKEDYKNE